MSKTYQLSTIKDIFDNVPTDKVDTCLAELGAGIKQAQDLRDSFKDLTGLLTSDHDNFQAFWRDSCTWIDDDKGNTTINTTTKFPQGE